MENFASFCEMKDFSRTMPAILCPRKPAIHRRPFNKLKSNLQYKSLNIIPYIPVNLNKSTVAEIEFPSVIIYFLLTFVYILIDISKFFFKQVF